MILEAKLEMAAPDPAAVSGLPARGSQAAFTRPKGLGGARSPVSLETIVNSELIAACQSGDAAGFAQLFEACQDRVYSIALRFSGDAASASDIAQDVFVKLFAQIKSFRSEARFESWLYRMVVNACLDERRRRRRWIPILAEATVEFLDRLAPSKAPVSVLDHLMGNEMQAQVQTIVAKLPVDLRIIVVLRYTEGLSYDAIGEILGCPSGTVASRLNRAHKWLEPRLAPLRALFHSRVLPQSGESQEKANV
jgi:RNA polymerase sigma-70 factor (ECF subfamily)